MLFKYSVRTEKKTPDFTITEINWLTLFKEIIAVYSQNHMKGINTLCGQNAEVLVIKAGDTYSYHCVLKSYIFKVFFIVAAVCGGTGPRGTTDWCPCAAGRALADGRGRQNPNDC
jgi:hypothetical protein